MEKPNQILTLLCFLFLTCGHLFAQKTGYEQRMEQLVSRLDSAATVQDYQALARDFMIVAEAEKKEWLPYYYAAYSNARAGWIYQTEDRGKIAPFADLAIKQIKTAEALLDPDKHKVELSEVYCIISLVNRERMYEKPMTISPKECGTAIIESIAKAKELNPDNPRVSYLEAWTKHHAPASMGGDPELAKQLFKKAIQQFKKSDPPYLYPNWGEADCHAFLEE